MLVSSLSHSSNSESWRASFSETTNNFSSHHTMLRSRRQNSSQSPLWLNMRAQVAEPGNIERLKSVPLISVIFVGATHFKRDGSTNFTEVPALLSLYNSDQSTQHLKDQDEMARFLWLGDILDNARDISDLLIIFDGVDIHQSGHVTRYIIWYEVEE
jgi:hypothetical protein